MDEKVIIQKIRLPESWASDWQLDKKLGSGAYATVWRAVRKDRPNIEAAIKIISIPASQADAAALKAEGMDASQSQTYYDDMAQQYIREIDVLDKLKGTTNIVSIEDYKVQKKEGEIGNDVFIRMELLTPLDSVLSRRTLTEEEVIQVGLDVCSALELCEDGNIIHRDIKPANIFINDRSKNHVFYKLGDFGIARSMQNLTSSLSAKGTPSYMAPEVFFGKKYDRRVDIYSLGITLYRLLNNNRPPFITDDISATAREAAITRRLGGEALPPPARGSEGLKQVILKACAFKPEHRYASASEMKADLEKVLRGEQININTIYPDDEATTDLDDVDWKADASGSVSRTKPVAPVSQPAVKTSAAQTEPVQPEKKKKKAGLWIALAAVLLALAVGAWALFGRQEPKPPVSTPEPTAVLTATPEVTEAPTAVPTDTPTPEPTETPTPTPTATPTPTPTPEPTPEPVQQVGYGITVGEKVYVQSQPSSKSIIIAELPEGQAVQVAGQIYPQNEADDYIWHKVVYDGENAGFIRADMLRMMSESEVQEYFKTPEPTPEPTPTPTPTPEPTPTSTPSPTPTPEPTPEPIILENLEVGGYVQLGTYPQTSRGGDSTPIDWLVLDIQDGKALLISKYGLDAQPYTLEGTDVTWETCTLRTWLNGEFLQNAFSKGEQAVILTTEVDNSPSQGNSEWKTDGGNNTQDRIFLLSCAEANKYFGITNRNTSNIGARVEPTAYTRDFCFAVLSDNYKTVDGADAGWWYLRSPGGRFDYASGVDFDGTFDHYAMWDAGGCIRPAMWVELAPDTDASESGALTSDPTPEPAAELTAPEVGSYVQFGTWPQTAEGTDHTPIDWLVLDVQDGKALLISKDGLAARPYHGERTGVSWETCDLRAWLNGEFLQDAFTEEEQAAILVSKIDNSKYQSFDEWTTNGGNDTEDRLFLLSYKEAKNYLNVGYVAYGKSVRTEARMAPTACALQNGAYISGEDRTEEGKDAGWWWLRSPGYGRDTAAFTRSDGSLHFNSVDRENGCVRPAVWVNLSLFPGESEEAAPEPTPTPAPTPEPTPEPTQEPTATPEPTFVPTPEPTQEPTAAPTPEPAPGPAAEQTHPEGIEAGSTVQFGTYPQTAEGTDHTPIDWLVLDVQDGKALLISQYGLDTKQYHTEPVDISWEQCTLRAWLNHSFLHSAFSTEEQSAILVTDVDNSSSQGYGKWTTEGGNNTQDRIFLLSCAEANRYLGVKHRDEDDGHNTGSCVAPTAYAISKGARTNSGYKTADGEPAGWWWLRSPGLNHRYAAEAYNDGLLNYVQVDFGRCVVRPVMWVDLAALGITDMPDAGTVSESTLTPIPEPTAEPMVFEAGGYIQFGTYPQAADGTDRTPIDWLVLDMQGGKALLISKYGLDAQPYNKRYSNITWEKCSLRSWLNQDFLQSAFSGEEQAAILTTTVDNGTSQNQRGWRSGGNTTKDRIFLLSYTEAYKYFKFTSGNELFNIGARVAPTAYATKQGAYRSVQKITTEGKAAGWWWLRSPGCEQNEAVYIDDDGSLIYRAVDIESGCVRPALWVDVNTLKQLLP